MPTLWSRLSKGAFATASALVLNYIFGGFDELPTVIEEATMQGFMEQLKKSFHVGSIADSCKGSTGLPFLAMFAQLVGRTPLSWHPSVQTTRPLFRVFSLPARSV